MNKQDKKDIEVLIKRLRKESDKEIKHYVGGLMEQYNWNLEAINENLKDVPEIKRMVNVMFEHMGLQEMDIALLKETAHRTKKRFQKLGV